MFFLELAIVATEYFFLFFQLAPELHRFNYILVLFSGLQEARARNYHLRDQAFQLPTISLFVTWRNMLHCSPKHSPVPSLSIEQLVSQ